MRWDVPIQLAQPRLTEDLRDKQPMATVAWNFFVALYYKAGGFPWVLDELPQGECFAGVSFHRHIGETRSGMYSSLAQIFSNRSEGVVLRGDKFQWDEKLGRSPHLGCSDASALAHRIVDEYTRVHHHAPTRLVIHKTSKYSDDELAGFREGLSAGGVHDYDLVAVCQRATRLFREGQFPPIRGTHACVAGSLHVLYTSIHPPAGTLT